MTTIALHRPEIVTQPIPQPTVYQTKSHRKPLRYKGARRMAEPERRERISDRIVLGLVLGLWAIVAVGGIELFSVAW